MLKRTLFRFVRSYATLDFRADTAAQQIEFIRRKAARYETLRHTAGTLACFI